LIEQRRITLFRFRNLIVNAEAARLTVKIPISANVLDIGFRCVASAAIQPNENLVPADTAPETFQDEAGNRMLPSASHRSHYPLLNGVGAVIGLALPRNPFRAYNSDSNYAEP
jgi:hypothetical protein